MLSIIYRTAFCNWTNTCFPTSLLLSTIDAIYIFKYRILKILPFVYNALKNLLHIILIFIDAIVAFICTHIQYQMPKKLNALCRIMDSKHCLCEYCKKTWLGTVQFLSVFSFAKARLFIQRELGLWHKIIITDKGIWIGNKKIISIIVSKSSKLDHIIQLRFS